MRAWLQHVAVPPQLGIRQVWAGASPAFPGELAGRVYIYVYIEPRQHARVREHTVFWNASDIEVNVVLRSGSAVNTELARALFAGGVAFATLEAAHLELEIESGSHYPPPSTRKQN